MSHFTVGIITKGKPTESKIAKILAPFQENNMGDCPQQYLEFEDMEDSERVRYETEKSREGTPFKTLYSTFEEFMKDWHGQEKRDEKKGRYGYWHNPNSKWDWYEIGGRWAGMIRVPADSVSAIENFKGEKSWTNEGRDVYESDDKHIVHVDSARIKDIIYHNEEDYKTALRFWELYIEEQEPMNDEERKKLEHVFYKKEYYLERYKTKENYAEVESGFGTYAVLKNGDWYEAGKMGWFGCSHASNEEKADFDRSYKQVFIDGAENDEWLTVVDCHI